MKKIKIFLKIIILFIGLFVGLFVIWNLYRYHIDYPMQDYEYKKAILKDSHNITYTLEALRPIMGPEELTEFIKLNDDNPQIYTPSTENIEKGIYKANLHTHTTMSDGKPDVEFRLNSAQDHAEKYIKSGYMHIAITDHNTVLGAKEVIRVLEKNKGKYDKIKVIPGMEINSEYNSDIIKKPIKIHVLAWCINPYDIFLNKEFYKKNLKDKKNKTYPDRDFNQVIKIILNYGIVGIAHPARYTTSMKDKKYPYITEIFTKYSALSNNILFTEGYYQSYKYTSTGPHLGEEYDKYINHINYEAKRLGIIRTGSSDSHGMSLYKYKDYN